MISLSLLITGCSSPNVILILVVYKASILVIFQCYITVIKCVIFIAKMFPVCLKMSRTFEKMCSFDLKWCFLVAYFICKCTCVILKRNLDLFDQIPFSNEFHFLRPISWFLWYSRHCRKFWSLHIWNLVEKGPVKHCVKMNQLFKQFFAGTHYIYSYIYRQKLSTENKYFHPVETVTTRLQFVECHLYHFQK